MNEPIPTNQRLKFLDLLKSLAIVAVVIYHYNNLSIDFWQAPTFYSYFSYFVKTILTVCVPIFFMVNGALLFNKDFDLKKHIRKLINVVVLTVIWAVLTLALLMPINHQYFTAREFINNLLTWKLAWINHLWFFQALAMVYLFFPLLKIAYDRQLKIFYFFLIAIGVLTFGNVFILNIINTVKYFFNISPLPEIYNIFNKFNFLTGAYGYTLVYFMLGALFLKYKDKFNTRRFRLGAILSIPVFMALINAYGFIMSRANHNVFDAVWRGYDMLPAVGLTLAVFILALNYRGRAYGLIKLIGANSLGIYLLHRFAGSWLLPYFKQLPFSQSLILNCLFAVIIVIICLGTVLGLKKIPFLKKLFSI